MSLQAMVAVIFGCLLSLPFYLNGQTPPSSSESTPSVSRPVQGYPEQAYLSPTRYTNTFFDFSLELPADAHLQPVPEPVATDERVQLLELGGPPPANAEISIVAFPAHAQAAPAAKALLRKALDQELFRGVEELRGLSKIMFAAHQFYFYETRRGIDQHMLAATNLNGYVVMMELGSHNEKMVKDLESCLQHIVFFEPAQAQQYVTAVAQAYEGPAIPSHRIAQLESDPPKNHLDPGKIEDGIYRNPTLGFTYQLPTGWVMEPQGAVLPAIERARAKDPLANLVDGVSPAADTAERALMKACSRTLFSVWAKPPGADGQIPYDDFGEVTLSAVSAECFSGVKFPASVSDRQTIRDFLLMLSLSNPILRDMRDAKPIAPRGLVFLLLHGTVTFQVPNDQLSRRLSVAMAITQRGGYLLTWFFAAPHDSELEPLLQERVAFEPEPATKNAESVKPVIGEPAGKDAVLPAATATNSAAVATSGQPPPSNPGTSASVPGGGATADSTVSSSAAGQDENSNSSANVADATSPTNNNSPSTPLATRPTLLRPGETIESQQANGPPVKKH